MLWSVELCLVRRLWTTGLTCRNYPELLVPFNVFVRGRFLVKTQTAMLSRVTQK